ncbi:hypothetical protein ACIQD3_11730 [Peribacillus loiseleuriae]|uniref:hypothetical protein n=1 Tax=Peribacillus loiseleuriae TaxID=1679170 RepID=UPI0038120A9B
MPEYGYYKKIPRPESIEYFKTTLKGHSKVSDITQLETQLFKITKTNDKEFLVHLTNFYIVGEAEVYEILSNHSDIKLDAIVTISNWNQCTSDGKIVAKQNDIGLFVMSDFLGAINYDGQNFINYISPAELERSKSRHR